ncbi:beta-lactamase family protein [Bacillus luteolus]|uniref:Beta-lactamase family protein n=2 Tax=Litchfieldia luteola TaxID=682179 RepID=A0ABR9QPY0_9BACI|nr:serine hydrolase domain-containing protein [Cytobacillus luteolus]MBE4910558.1 beta-lactamase family protein [Cytobacillus luteolus]MBP1943735.1 CubicO group peptidase (beta-lactamase class C family) [Cytobacillus luteolus]
MDEKVKVFIESQIHAGVFPGAVVYVKKDNTVLLHEAYGKALNTKDDKRDMNKDTLFDIASLTKVVITTIILKLISENKFSLHSTVAELLPAVTDESIGTISLQQLLTHSSGLLDWYPFYSSSEDFYNQLVKIVSTNEKTEGVRYSDLNYMLLAEIVKESTKRSLQEALNQYIRIPLNAKTMSYGPVVSNNVAATEFGNRIEQNMCKERNVSFSGWRDINLPICGQVNDGNAYYYFKGVSGHAGLFADAEDLSKIGEVYTNLGKLDGKEYISQSIVEQAIAKQIGTRGLGWELSDIYPTGCGHTGFTGTSLWIDPVRRLTVVVLTNRLHTDSPQNINAFRRKLHEMIDAAV